MPIQPPNLDDRTYDELLAGARALIPRYTPEWTDFNESDPGITLLELFSWMTEILLYRLNQVPELNYLKFLQLLGFELIPAQPAKADLSFALVPKRTDFDSVIVPKGTQVAAAASGSGGPPVFETDTALIALNATLANVQNFDGFSYTDETKKNALPGQSFCPFGTTLREGASSLLLGFDSPLDSFTTQQVNLTVYVSTPAGKTPTRQCNLEVTTLPTQAAFVWECWDTTQWVPIILDKDETRSFIQSGHIYFRVPGDTIKKDQIGIVSSKLFWVRARLVTNQYETTPQLEMVQINTVGASQAVTVLNEILGASNGEADQVLQLSHIPVVVRDTPLEQKRTDGTIITVTSLWLEIDEGDGNGPQPWQEVSDFYNSGKDDPHYVLNRTTGEVKFGNGTTHGRIPVATVNTSAIIAREYRYGGGAQGNVAANSITQLETSVDYVDSVTNIRPASGGSDEEKLEDAKLRAAAGLKSRDRAVTAEDFESIAVETPSAQIQRAKALPLAHPQFPGQPIPGVVTVIVVPGSDNPKPTPSPATLAIVCSYLNKHRLLTSEVYVVPPTFRNVRIEASIIVNPNADLSVVKNAVEDGLNTYFHPLRGGKDGQGWVFGQDIYYSGVFRVVLDTPDVDRLDGDLLIFLDNEQQQPYRDVPIGEGNLISSEQPVIQARYNF